MCHPVFVSKLCSITKAHPPPPHCGGAREAERERELHERWLICIMLIDGTFIVFNRHVYISPKSVDFSIRVELLESDKLGLVYMRRQVSERLEQRDFVR